MTATTKSIRTRDNKNNCNNKSRKEHKTPKKRSCVELQKTTQQQHQQEAQPRKDET